MGIEIYFTGELKHGIDKFIQREDFKSAEEISLRVN